LRDPEASTGYADDLDLIGKRPNSPNFANVVGGWDLAAYRESVPGPHFADVSAGAHWAVEGGDVVSAAPALARLTLNIAMAHFDCQAGHRGRRLVYGGHTIGLAAAQLTRVIPALVTIVGWHSCEHLNPVFENDTLISEVEVERVEPRPDGGGILHLRSQVRAFRADEPVRVLDWRLAAVMA
jgi:acyl dehydratase